MKLLDEKGLTTVWAAIKNTFTSKSDADGKYAEKSKALGSINFDYTAWGLNMSTYNVDGDGCGYINITPATSKIAGVMSAADKTKLDGIAENANNYSLPLAATSTRGGIQLGYSQNGRNYPVQLSGEKAYVNVPWTDTNTTYDLSSYSQKDETVKNISNSMLGVSTSGYKQILEIDYANGTTKNVEISNASGGLNGFMSASDKNKLDNIAAGANNYTLPIASDTTLGGIKTGYTQRTSDISYPVSVDKAGNAWVTIPDLYCRDGLIERLTISDPNTDDNAIYYHDGIEVNGSKISFPKKSGTFALTSDISPIVFEHATDGNVYIITYIGMHQVDLLEKSERYNVFDWFNYGEKGSILDIYCDVGVDNARLIVTNEVQFILNGKGTNVISTTNKHIRLINCDNYILVAEYNTNETAG